MAGIGSSVRYRLGSQSSGPANFARPTRAATLRDLPWELVNPHSSEPDSRGQRCCSAFDLSAQLALEVLAQRLRLAATLRNQMRCPAPSGSQPASPRRSHARSLSGKHKPKAQAITSWLQPVATNPCTEFAGSIILHPEAPGWPQSESSKGCNRVSTCRPQFSKTKLGVSCDTLQLCGLASYHSWHRKAHSCALPGPRKEQARVWQHGMSNMLGLWCCTQCSERTVLRCCSRLNIAILALFQSLTGFEPARRSAAVMAASSEQPHSAHPALRAARAQARRCRPEASCARAA